MGIFRLHFLQPRALLSPPSTVPAQAPRTSHSESSENFCRDLRVDLSGSIHLLRVGTHSARWDQQFLSRWRSLASCRLSAVELDTHLERIQSVLEDPNQTETIRSRALEIYNQVLQQLPHRGESFTRALQWLHSHTATWLNPLRAAATLVEAECYLKSSPAQTSELLRSFSERLLDLATTSTLSEQIRSKALQLFGATARSLGERDIEGAFVYAAACRLLSLITDPATSPLLRESALSALMGMMDKIPDGETLHLIEIRLIAAIEPVLRDLNLNASERLALQAVWRNSSISPLMNEGQAILHRLWTNPTLAPQARAIFLQIWIRRGREITPTLARNFREILENPQLPTSFRSLVLYGLSRSRFQDSINVENLRLLESAAAGFLRSGLDDLWLTRRNADLYQRFVLSRTEFRRSDLAFLLSGRTILFQLLRKYPEDESLIRSVVPVLRQSLDLDLLTRHWASLQEQERRLYPTWGAIFHASTTYSQILRDLMEANHGTALEEILSDAYLHVLKDFPAVSEALQNASVTTEEVDRFQQAQIAYAYGRLQNPSSESFAVLVDIGHALQSLLRGDIYRPEYLEPLWNFSQNPRCPPASQADFLQLYVDALRASTPRNYQIHQNPIDQTPGLRTGVDRLTQLILHASPAQRSSAISHYYKLMESFVYLDAEMPWNVPWQALYERLRGICMGATPPADDQEQENASLLLLKLISVSAHWNSEEWSSREAQFRNFLQNLPPHQWLSFDRHWIIYPFFFEFRNDRLTVSTQPRALDLYEGAISESLRRISSAAAHTDPSNEEVSIAFLFRSYRRLRTPETHARQVDFLRQVRSTSPILQDLVRRLMTE